MVFLGKRGSFAAEGERRACARRTEQKGTAGVVEALRGAMGFTKGRDRTWERARANARKGRGLGRENPLDKPLTKFAERGNAWQWVKSLLV